MLLLVEEIEGKLLIKKGNQMFQEVGKFHYPSKMKSKTEVFALISFELRTFKEVLWIRG